MRPWRLTRRARVEMEGALMALRMDLVDGGNRSPDFPTVENGAWALGVIVMGPKWIEVGTLARAHEWRILRARVALALRAALRADEDARCEEAMEATSWGHGDDRFYGGADAAIDALREWAPLVARYYRVPRALWEVAR